MEAKISGINKINGSSQVISLNLTSGSRHARGSDQQIIKAKEANKASFEFAQKLRDELPNEIYIELEKDQNISSLLFNKSGSEKFEYDFSIENNSHGYGLLSDFNFTILLGQQPSKENITSIKEIINNHLNKRFKID